MAHPITALALLILSLSLYKWRIKVIFEIFLIVFFAIKCKAVCGCAVEERDKGKKDKG